MPFGMSETVSNTLLTGKPDELLEPEFLEKLLKGEGGSPANVQALEVVELRRTVEGIRQGRRAYNLTLVNVALTFCIVVATAVNVWKNW